MGQGKTPRAVKARRMLTIGGVAASLAVPVAAGATGIEQVQAQAGAEQSLLVADGEGEGTTLPAPAEGEGASAGGEGEGEGASAGGEGEGASAGGEGEGEGASAGGEGEGGSDGAAPNVAFLRDLGFMTGHLRAGMALYEEGDVEAAKTHMGHPIEEKYGAVADELDRLGYGTLRDDLLALSAATEEGAPAEEIRSLYDAVIAKADAAAGAASPASPRERLSALAALGRIAADEYAVGLEGGQLSNLHEYQDSWGFLRTIETEAGKLAQSEDQAVADAANQIIVLVEGLADSYGDLQGQNLTAVDPSVLYGAAARMEIAALGVR